MNGRSNEYDEARLSLRFVLTGQLFLVAWGVVQAIVAPALTGYPYGPGILALTHLLTLGWATTTCLGVLAQLLPVLLQQPLSHQRLARGAFWPLAAGAAWFSWAFVAGSAPWLIAGATLLAAGLLALAWSFGRTLRAARIWNATTAGIGLALGALVLQVAAGLALTLNRRFGFWPGLGLNGAAGHAMLGLIGWFSLLTVALSYRLVGMFTLAHGYACRFQGAVLGGLAVAAAGSWLGLTLGAPRSALAACALLAGGSALLWLVDLRGLIRHRVRRRLELPIRLFLLGGFAMLLLSGLAAAGAMGWLPGAPARQIQLIFMLGMEGWIGLAIVALLHKIIPFLVWIIRAGQSRQATPAVARDLFSERLSRLTLGAYLIGVGLSCGGVAAGRAGLIQVGGGLIALAGLGLLANSRRAWQAQVTPRQHSAATQGVPAAGFAAQD